MVTVWLSESLREVAGCEDHELVEGSTVGRALSHLFAKYRPLRAHVLDDQGIVRRRISVLVNGRLVNDADFLTDAISDGAQIHLSPSLVDRSQMRSVRDLLRPARRDELDCVRRLDQRP